MSQTGKNEARNRLGPPHHSFFLFSRWNWICFQQRQALQLYCWCTQELLLAAPTFILSCFVVTPTYFLVQRDPKVGVVAEACGAVCKRGAEGACTEDVVACGSRAWCDGAEPAWAAWVCLHVSGTWDICGDICGRGGVSRKRIGQDDRVGRQWGRSAQGGGTPGETTEHDSGSDGIRSVPRGSA